MYEITNKSQATQTFWVKDGKERKVASIGAGQTASLNLLNRDSAKVKALEAGGHITVSGGSRTEKPKDTAKSSANAA